MAWHPALMTQEPTHIPARNRRFLVSIWLSEPGAELAGQAITGVIWNADPAEAGQLDAGSRFNALDELPKLMQSLITPSGNDPQEEVGP